MSNLLKLGLAIGLAVAAGIGNFVYLTTKDLPSQFVRVKEDIEERDLIEANDLESVPIPGKRSELAVTFIPYDERSVLYGLPAPRNLKKGHLISHEDISSSKPRWETLGPFTLLSVGNRVRSATGRNYSAGREGDTITVVATLDEGQFDDMTQRLLDIVDARSNRSKNAADLRIVTITLYPQEKSADLSETETAGSGDSATDSSNDSRHLPINSTNRGIVVPLKGIESVPELLVRGDQIGFVVPYRSR